MLESNLVEAEGRLTLKKVLIILAIIEALVLIPTVLYVAFR